MPHATSCGYNADTEEEPSAGTSSLTSESKPDKSGETPTIGHPSPAPDAENLSDKGQELADPNSPAPSTDGSTQETGSGQPSLSISSEEFQVAEGSDNPPAQWRSS